MAPYYDSLLAKLVVHGRDRQEAVARSVQALEELCVEGVSTTRDVHLRLLKDSVLRDGPVTTSWLERLLASSVTGGPGRLSAMWKWSRRYRNLRYSYLRDLSILHTAVRH